MMAISQTSNDFQLNSFSVCVKFCFFIMMMAWYITHVVRSYVFRKNEVG